MVRLNNFLLVFNLIEHWQRDDLTLTSSLKTACWIILLLFRPDAISSRSMADLQGQKQAQHTWKGPGHSDTGIRTITLT